MNIARFALPVAGICGFIRVHYIYEWPAYAGLSQFCRRDLRQATGYPVLGRTQYIPASNYSLALDAKGAIGYSDWV
ncbi:MAG TPA: hypothetical protein DCG91_03400 [Clostridiales bacterium UBA9857]|jgi:hypothetical protein|nr:hypothetical protein [Clostridiales bacterium UBA9857]HOA71555.1 hypothetical protein [Bacillota bacterium]